jgi:hypothetical protein
MPSSILVFLAPELKGSRRFCAAMRAIFQVMDVFARWLDVVKEHFCIKTWRLNCWELGGLEDLVEELRREESAKVVISSTMLLSLIRRPGALHALREGFQRAGYAITWMIYLLPYDEWLEAMYVSLLVKTASSVGFEAWQAANRNHAIADPEKSLAPLFLTTDKVVVRSYSQHAQNMAADFLGLMGVPLPETCDNHVNPAPQILQVELCKKVAEFAALYLDCEGERRVFGRMRQAIPDLPASPPYRCLERNLSQRLRDETRASYRNMLRAAGVPQDYDAFFPKRPKYEVTTLDAFPLSMDEKADFHKILLHCILA